MLDQAIFHFTDQEDAGHLVVLTGQSFHFYVLVAREKGGLNVDMVPGNFHRIPVKVHEFLFNIKPVVVNSYTIGNVWVQTFLVR